MHFRKLLLTLFFILFTSNSFAAPVSGFAIVFPTREPISNATITILENGTKILTDSDGKFGPFDYPVGKPITLVLEKKGLQTTQSATIIVPKNGLNDLHHNITFQVPTTLGFWMLTKIVHAKLNDDYCHVASTITARGKTLKDKPQGEEHAKIVLSPATTDVPFYFGIFKRWPFKDETNPFVHGLTDASLDGGVAIFNLQPMDKPYTLTATKDGVTFTETKFICRKGMFVNLSPPQGPSVI